MMTARKNARNSHPHHKGRHRAGVRHRLLTSGATGACLAAMIAAAPALAATANSGTAFQGAGTVVSGNATINQTPGLDTITVSSPQAVINWTPDDRGASGNIDFLPQGSTGLFQGNADFTVLNRIIALNGQDMPVARLIELNGTVQSRIVDGQTGATARGGNVWFYSPGGLLIGASGVIDVGGLVLTSRDIDTTGGLFGANGQIRFRDPNLAGSESARVDVLGSITAGNGTAGGSYVALVAPRVVQQGTISVDGSAALVAAEQADLTINHGLFDITVLVGSGDANGVVHSGTTRGPSDTSTVNENRAYLVAVPKNQAMTMLVAGDIGFETPLNVGVAANGGIVLSAGHNITGGAIGALAPTGGANAAANIQIADTRFANNLTASAANSLNSQIAGTCNPCTAGSTIAGSIQVNGNATLSAGTSTALSAVANQRIGVTGALTLSSNGDNQTGSVNLTSGGTVAVGGALTLSSDSAGIAGINGGNANAGLVGLAINGGQLSAASVSVSANAAGANGSTSGGSATGGSASLSVNGGQLTTGAITVSATGQSGTGSATSGNSFGGAASFNGSGAIVQASSLTLDASATIGAVTTTGGSTGIASGGNASVDLSATNLTLSGTMTFNASANAATPSIGNIGARMGGNVSLQVRDGSQAMVGNGITIDASAHGASFNNPAVTSDAGAVGGVVGISSDNLGMLTTTQINADAIADVINATGTVGTAAGGAITLSATNESAITLAGGQQSSLVSLDTSAFGGNAPIAGGAIGGAISLTADGSTLALGSLTTLNATGFSGVSTGTSAPSGDGAPLARGGEIIFNVNANTGGGDSLLSFASLFGNADGRSGGNSESQFFSTGFGVRAIGGTISFNQRGGATNGTFIDLSAGGFGSSGSSGTGGTVNVTQSSGAYSVATTSLESEGFGGGGIYANSGATGTGGTVNIALSGGTLSGSSLSVFAQGTGGDGGFGGDFAPNNATPAAPGSGGTGLGGSIHFDLDGNANANLTSMTLDATGFGGEGGSFGYDGGSTAQPANGGSGLGGSIDVDLTSGMLSADFITARANGQGGIGGFLFASGEGAQLPLDGSLTAQPVQGGFAQGGTSTITLSTSTVSAQYLIDSSATAGEGGAGLVGGRGGNAQGGTSRLVIDDFNAGALNVELRSRAFGGIGITGATGNGGTGGDTIGGTGELVVNGLNGHAIISDNSFNIGGFGGAGSNGILITPTFGAAPVAGNGGNGGQGTGGTISLVTNDGQIAVRASNNEDVLLRSSGTGGSGGNGANNSMGSPTVPATGGNAGFAGNATGGTISLSANGGTIGLEDADLSFEARVDGIGGMGGMGGAGVAVFLPDPQNPNQFIYVGGGGGFSTGNGFDIGGNINFAAANGADGGGRISLTNALLNANGALGGRITLLDDAMGAGLQFGTLEVNATGGAITSSDFSQIGTGLFIRSQTGAITFGNNLTVHTGGAFEIRADGTGGVSVGLAADINADFQSYGRHINNAAGNATLSAASISINTSSLDFGPNTLILADGSINIETDALLDNLGRLNFATIRSDSGDVLLNAKGYITGGTLDAFGEINTSSAGMGMQITDPMLMQGDTRITSVSGERVTMTAAAGIKIGQLTTAINQSGGFDATAPIVGGQTAMVQAPAAPGDAVLTATGSIALDTVDIANMLSAVAGPNGDITVGQGTVDGLMLLDAGRDITTGSIGMLTVSDDAELTAGRDITATRLAVTAGSANTLSLTAGRTTGFGTINSTGDISIDSGDVSATGGTATATGLLSIISRGSTPFALSGNIAVGSISADQIAVESANGISFASSNSGGLTTMAARGGIAGTTLTTSDGDARLTANGGDITLSTATIGDNLMLSASQRVTLGTSVSNYATTILAGTGTSITSARTTGIGSQNPLPVPDITIMSGGTTTLGTLNSAGNILVSSTSIDGASSALTAVNDVTVRGTNSATFGTIDARTATVSTSTDFVNFTRITTSGATSIAATGNATGGSIMTGNGAVSVASAEGNIDIASIGSGGTSSLTATGGSVNLGTLTSAGASSIDAGGDATLTMATVTGALTVDSGANASIGRSSSTGATTISATGSVGVTQAVQAGTAITIDGASIAATGSSISGSALDIEANAGNAMLGTLSGGSVALTATGAVSFNDLTGGTAHINAGQSISGQTVDVNALTATAAGGIDIASIFASDDIALSAGGLVAGDFAESSFGSILIDAGSVDYGELYASGQINIDSAGNVALTFGQTGGEGCVSSGCDSAVGGDQQGLALVGAASDILIDAGGIVTLGELDSANNVLIDAASLTGTSSSILAQDRVTITTSGNAAFGSIEADDGISLTSGGSASGAMVQTNRPGGTIALSGTNGTTVATVRSADLTSVSAANGAVAVSDLQSTGAVSASGRSIAITSSSPTVYTSVTATAGDATLLATSGDLSVNTATASGALALTTRNGAITLGNATAGTAALNSSSTATISGNAISSGQMQVTSRGATIVNGTASGSAVRIRSGDIVIGANGRIGTAGTTTLVDLTNGDGAARTFIGGSDSSGNYSLSAAEMTRLFGTDIAIHAPRASTQGGSVLGSTRPPDVIVGAFTINGGGAATGANLGTAGTLSIDTPGALRVVGAARVDNAAAANGFTITATEVVEVIQGQGSLRVGNGSALAGSLTITSDDIAVATSAAIAEIATAPSVAAVNTRLAQNDGSTSDEGALAAGTLRLNATNGLYIQNSGTGTEFADRRGFTANSLFVSTPSTSTRIVINGRIAGVGGALQTGVDALRLATINETSGGSLNGAATIRFDRGSTINGCAIVGQSGCGRQEIFFPIQDVINTEVSDNEDENESGGANSTAVINIAVDIKDVAPLSNDPIVDEPVTGAGNDDLWSNGEEDAPCDASSGASCPAQ